MKDKKGFTLIEIIISIALISIIGVSSIVGIRYAQNKSLQKKIDKAFKVFDNALNVYLSNHEEVYTNLSDNVEGAVITFELLKNEGLVDDNIIDPKTNKKVDYLNHYYVLADAVQLANNTENTEEDESDSTSCEGQVELKVIKNWKDISNDAEKEVLYICPKSDTTNQTEKNKNATQELEERVRKLEKIVNNMNMGDNNFVIFDVNYDQNSLANFGSSESTTKDIWRFVNKGNKYSLMYYQPIYVDYSQMFPDVVNDIVKQREYYNKRGTKISSEITAALSTTDCKNGKTFTAKEIDSGEIGNNFAANDVGYMQSIYYTGNKEKFYDYISSYTYSDTNCIIVKEIPDFKNYIYSNSDYALLNDSYENYYYNKNYYKVDFFDKTDRVDYISIFDLDSSQNPIKSSLLGRVNNNLQKNLKNSSYKYFYEISDNTFVQGNNGDTRKNKFRILSKDEIAKNESWLSTYTLPIGISAYSSLIGESLNKLNNAEGSSAYMLFSSFGEKLNYKNLVTKYKGIKTIYSSGSSINLSSNVVYSVATAPYYPVIDLNGVSDYLDQIDQYPNSYKEKYKKNGSAECTNADLGSIDCPYLLKFNDGYLSNGEKY